MRISRTLTRDAQPELPLRITVLDPTPGVTFAMQRGRMALLPPTRRAPGEISFDFTVRIGADRPDGKPNFLGEYAQGTAADRFVYVNSGASAGQFGTPWNRRAKIRLGTITREMVDAALATPGAVLEARIQGTGRDGGPACASVPLLDGGWRLLRP